MFGDSRTRVLLAVINLPFPTARGVALEVGISLSNAHRHLLALERDGLVAWNNGRQAGTLRALVHEVPVDA